MKQIKINLFVMLACGLLFTANQVVACDFKCVLEQHLNAIQTKDFKSFEQTLTQGKTLTFILPNGKYFSDAAEYRAMLKEWFTTSGWSFDYQIVELQQTKEMGHALLLVNYNEADRDGKPYHIDHYLSLLFMVENGQWRLVHDQNTLTQIEQTHTSEQQ